MGCSAESCQCIFASALHAGLDLYDDEVHPAFTDYDLGMAYAAQKGLPVVLDFTGFGCVNCRKMGCMD